MRVFLTHIQTDRQKKIYCNKNGYDVDVVAFVLLDSCEYIKIIKLEYYYTIKVVTPTFELYKTSVFVVVVVVVCFDILDW